MTLVVTVSGRDTIWLLADRRLSYQARPPKDDACKLMCLETTDGVAILGYAGLGATPHGTQPADWMSAVLRGRKLPLEQSLGVLAAAMKKQFPRHMLRMPVQGAPAHTLVATAFLGGEARLYTIDLVLSPDRKGYHFRYTSHVANPTQDKARPPRLSISGSGALYLLRNKKWIRPLLRLVRAHDRGQVTARTVGAHLASLNYEVHLGVGDNTVGPRCIVAWRRRKGGTCQGGGGHVFYTGTTHDASSPSLPAIVNGMDMRAIIGALMPHFNKTLESFQTGEPAEEMNKDEMNAMLARLPYKPDENLR